MGFTTSYDRDIDADLRWIDLEFIAANEQRILKRTEPIAPQTLRRATSAPEAHDGFGTKTLDLFEATAQSGNQWRLVAIEPEHIDWQSLRYASAGYACMTQTMFLDLVGVRGDARRP